MLCLVILGRDGVTGIKEIKGVIGLLNAARFAGFLGLSWRSWLREYLRGCGVCKLAEVNSIGVMVV